MSVYKNQYVIINIWTNSRNKALPGENDVGHISITTRNTHISLWPKRPSLTQSSESSFFNSVQGFFSPFISLPTHYKPDYDQDCILEGAAINAQSVGAATQFKAGEKPYRYNPENGLYEEVDVDSVPRASEYHYYKIKPLEANFRMVLYSLDVQKVEGEFNDLKRSVQGWTLLGSNTISRSVNKETNESCSSLVYRCLEAGGLYSSLSSTVSSQTSCAVDPENLLRHVVSAKAKELKEYPRTANWVIEGVNETPLDVVSEAYSENGLNASIEDDFIPGIKPSWSTCNIQ